MHARKASLAVVSDDWSAATAVEWVADGDYADIRYERSPRARDREDHDRPPGGPQRLPAADRGRAVDAFTRAREDTEVGVIMLTGEGGRRVLLRRRPARARRLRGYESAPGAVGRFHVTDLHVQIRRTPKPVVAMVAGYAIGGGHVLHVVCDLTIAAENARFGQTGPRVGSFDGGYGASILAAQIGRSAPRRSGFSAASTTRARRSRWGS